MLREEKLYDAVWELCRSVHGTKSEVGLQAQNYIFSGNCYVLNDQLEPRENQGEYLDLLLLELNNLLDASALIALTSAEVYVCLLRASQIEASYFIGGFHMTSLKFKLQTY